MKQNIVNRIVVVGIALLLMRGNFVSLHVSNHMLQNELLMEKTKYVLCVDDEISMRTLIKDYLSGFGIKVIALENPLLIQKNLAILNSLKSTSSETDYCVKMLLLRDFWHDYNNQLAAIVGFFDLFVMRDSQKNAEFTSATGVVLKRLERIQLYSNGLLKIMPDRDVLLSLWYRSIMNNGAVLKPAKLFEEMLQDSYLSKFAKEFMERGLLRQDTEKKDKINSNVFSDTATLTDWYLHAFDNYNTSFFEGILSAQVHFLQTVLLPNYQLLAISFQDILYGDPVASLEEDITLRTSLFSLYTTLKSKSISGSLDGGSDVVKGFLQLLSCDLVGEDNNFNERIELSSHFLTLWKTFIGMSTLMKEPFFKKNPEIQQVGWTLDFMRERIQKVFMGERPALLPGSRLFTNFANTILVQT